MQSHSQKARRETGPTSDITVESLSLLSLLFLAKSLSATSVFPVFLPNLAEISWSQRRTRVLRNWDVKWIHSMMLNVVASGTRSEICQLEATLTCRQCRQCRHSNQCTQGEFYIEFCIHIHRCSHRKCYIIGMRNQLYDTIPSIPSIIQGCRPRITCDMRTEIWTLECQKNSQQM